MNNKYGFVKLDTSPKPEGYHRAYELSNGDVFTVKGKHREYTLEFEDGLLYDVSLRADDQSNQYSYINGQWVQSEYKRTGVVYTVDELNNLISG